ncbi:hydrolase, alpha/beta domain protein [Enterococcus faecalis 02-MB-P-10]|nr:hydrolase, alpha/beta domain protein [Enterococcus faecalis 02-MB-P-10]
MRTNYVVVFPEYTRSPEAKYQTEIVQTYSVLQKLSGLANEKNMDLSKITIAGDSVGGNMATVLTIMTKQRGGLPISQQLLYYPITDANFNTESYTEFVEGGFLTKSGIQWFWDQYTEDEQDRNKIIASPLKATADELRGLPESMIINGEADVLRDEGELYASKIT